MKPIRACLAAAFAVVVAACSVLPKQEPVTTLVLPLADAPLASPWPEGVTAGRVSAAAALANDRVLVLSGARLMQAPGLAWAAPPGTLLAEQVARLQARANHADARNGLARLDLMVDAFWWQADAAEVLVRAHGALRCPDGRTVALPETAATVPLVSVDDAEAVATAFAEASRTAVAALLAGASESPCAR